MKKLLVVVLLALNTAGVRASSQDALLAQLMNGKAVALAQEQTSLSIDQKNELLMQELALVPAVAPTAAQKKKAEDTLNALIAVVAQTKAESPAVQTALQSLQADIAIDAQVKKTNGIDNSYCWNNLMLHPIPGGAAARPFVTHHNALDVDLYLRIAPELYLKRLVVGGFERVFEINRNFRNEGVSTRHNPEFTMVEFYIAHQDYFFMMDFVEKMIREMVMQACQTLHIPFAGQTVDFESPFKRITVKDAVLGYTSYSQADLQPENIDKILNEHVMGLEP